MECSSRKLQGMVNAGCAGETRAAESVQDIVVFRGGCSEMGLGSVMQTALSANLAVIDTAGAMLDELTNLARRD